MELVRELRNPLGSFLQARRARVTPEQKHLPVLGARRVTGLRREEVALLAGISADYYLRLERGRDRNPSEQVLRSIARVLELDDVQTTHLLTLGSAAVRPSDAARRRAEPMVPAGVRSLVHAMALPAWVENRSFDIVVANAAARELSPRLVAGRNRLRDVLLDEAERALLPDHDRAAACLVGSLHRVLGSRPDDADVLDLVAEMSTRSADFRRLWNRHDVQDQYGDRIAVQHPVAGLLMLHRERLSIDGTDALALIALHADEGSGEAEQLAAWTAATGSV